MSSKFAVKTCKKAKSFIYILPGKSQSGCTVFHADGSILLKLLRDILSSYIPQIGIKTCSTLSAQAQIFHFNLLAQAYFSAKSSFLRFFMADFL